MSILPAVVLIIGGVVFFFTLVCIVKGAMAPKNSLKPRNFQELWQAFTTASTGGKWFLAFLVIWPEDAKSKAVIYAALAAVILAIAGLIGLPAAIWGKPHENLLRKLVDAVVKAIVRYLPGHSPGDSTI